MGSSLATVPPIKETFFFGNGGRSNNGSCSAGAAVVEDVFAGSLEFDGTGAGCDWAFMQAPSARSIESCRRRDIVFPSSWMQLTSKEWPKSLKIRGKPGKRELLNGHHKATNRYNFELMKRFQLF